MFAQLRQTRLQPKQCNTLLRPAGGFANDGAVWITALNSKITQLIQQRDGRWCIVDLAGKGKSDSHRSHAPSGTKRRKVYAKDGLSLQRPSGCTIRLPWMAAYAD